MTDDKANSATLINKVRQLRSQRMSHEDVRLALGMGHHRYYRFLRTHNLSDGRQYRHRDSRFIGR